MNERDKIIATFESVPVPKLLVATIPLILGVEKHDHWKGERRIPADVVTFFESSVGRGVVDNQNVDFISLLKFDWNSQNYLANGSFRVVGNDENEYSRFSVVTGHNAV